MYLRNGTRCVAISVVLFEATLCRAALESLTSMCILHYLCNQASDIGFTWQMIMWIDLESRRSSLYLIIITEGIMPSYK